MPKRRNMLVLVAVALLYVGGYLFFRATHTEVWQKNGRAYVIFPREQRWLYYLFRPLTYADTALSGISIHLGPHAEPAANGSWR